MNSNNKIDLPSLAKKSTGVFDFKKYLYDAGLSNIYEDYQTNIGSLDKAKQQQIQDAYTIREMSKKYLGEYASDTGVGDISGSLLDIYGQYQKSIQDIGMEFGDKKFSLEQEYRTNRFNMLAQQLENQYNLEVAKLDQLAQDVITNIAMGDIGEMTPLEYVESQKDNLDQNTYSALYRQVYADTVTKDLMTPKSYKDPTSDIFDPEYDPSYTFTGVEKGLIGKESDVFQIGGKEFAQVLVDVNDDITAKNPVDSFELTQYYQDNFGVSPNPGEIMQYAGDYYEFKSTPQGSTWYRLVTSSGSKTSFDATLLTKDSEGNVAPNKEVQSNWDASSINYNKIGGRDTFEYNGNIYIEDKTDTSFKPSTTDPKQQEIINKFREVHGDKQDVVIYWNGKFYNYNKRGYTVMNKIN